MIGNKVGGQKIGGHQEHSHLCRSQSLFDFNLPLCPGLNRGVVPDRDRLKAGERPQHDLESPQPFGIRMTIANEDLSALWGSHGVPPFLTADDQLMCPVCCLEGDYS